MYYMLEAVTFVQAETGAGFDPLMKKELALHMLLQKQAEGMKVVIEGED